MTISQRLEALAQEAGFSTFEDITFRDLASRLAAVRAVRDAARVSERIVLAARRRV